MADIENYPVISNYISPGIYNVGNYYPICKKNYLVLVLLNFPSAFVIFPII